MLGAAYVRGLQSAGVIATLKHFAGYSASRAARNHGPVSMGRRELLRRHPAAVRDGRRARRRRLGDELLLRRRRRPGRRRPLAAHRRAARASGASTGTVVSDYWAVPFLATMHRVAADADERRRAGARPPASTSSCPTRSASAPDSSTGSAAGELAEELVDRAARRVLTAEGRARPARRRTGRRRARSRDAAEVDLDSPAQPGARPGAGRALDRPARRRHPRCRCSARAGRRCAGSPSSGPCADDAAHVHGLLRLPQPRAAALSRHRPRHRGADRRSTRCAPSCPESRSCTSRAARCCGDDRSGFAAAVAAAREADLCVAFVGDLAGLFGHGTSGEGCDAEDLRLPGVQADLLEELLETGTPVVVVVVSGRPYALGDVRTTAPPRSSRRSCPARRAARRSPACCPAGCSPAGKLPGADPARARAASRAPTCSRRSGGRERRHQQPRPDAAVPVRLRPLVHHLRASTTCGSAPTEVPHRRRVHRDGARAQHRARGPATRWSSSTCTTCVAQVARPVQQLTGFARVSLEPGAGRGRALHRARRPHRLHRPRTCGASSSRATWRSWSAPRRPTCRCRATVAAHRPACASWRPRPAADHAGRVVHPAPGARAASAVEEDVRRARRGRAGHAGHRRRLGRRVGRHGVEGPQRPHATSPPATRARVQDLLARARATSAGASSQVDAQPTVELVFHGRARRRTRPRSSRACWTRPPSSASRGRRQRPGRERAGRSGLAPGPGTWPRPAGAPSSP